MNLARPSAATRGGAAGFTLIEILLVVGIMALIAATAVPNIYQLAKKEGMRRAISDLKEVCDNARAQAIFSGKPVAVVFYPRERTFYIGSGSPVFDPMTGQSTRAELVKPGTGTTGIIPDDINLEMLDVNGLEYKDSDWVDVWFYQDGTCEELVINYSSPDTPSLWIKLDPATSAVIIGEKP